MSIRNSLRISAFITFSLILSGISSSLLELFPSHYAIIFALTSGIVASGISIAKLKNEELRLLILISVGAILSIGIQLAAISFKAINPIDIMVALIILTVGYTINYFYQSFLLRIIGSITSVTSFSFLAVRYFEITALNALIYFSFLAVTPLAFTFAKSISKKKIILIPAFSLGILTLVNFVNWGKNGLLNEGRVSIILASGLMALTLVISEKFIFQKDKVVVSSLAALLVLGMVPTVNGLSKDSIEKVTTVVAASKRSAEVEGYRLPGVGYKEALRGKTFKECDEGSTLGRDCFITIYVDMAKERGVKEALVDVIDAVNNNRGEHFAAHCHQVTHAIGIFAGQTDYKAKAIEGLKLEPQVCATGYTHGIFEAYWKPITNEELLKKAPMACKELGMDKGFYRWTCNHILGHVLVTRDELHPGPQLRSCLKIPDEHSANDCLSGGWMQFFSDDPILAMFKAQNATFSDIFKYCNDEPQQSQRMCYQETFPSLSIIKNSNFASEMKDCSKASDETNMIWCIQGVARAIAITGGYTVPFAKAECAKTEEGLVRDYCYTASAASITLNMGIINETRKMCDLVIAKDVNAYCKRWVRDSRKLIASGPNSQNIPKF